MKFTNTLNGHTYWIEDGVVYVSNGELTFKSNMTKEMMMQMIEDGNMINKPEDVEPDFYTKVMSAKDANPQLSLRFIAFKIANNDHESSVMRNVRFMHWISDMVCLYEIAHPDRVLKSQVGSASIIDQNDFTDFIVSGRWMK